MALSKDKAAQNVHNMWLKKMRQQYLEGTFCDVIIRVTLQQDASSGDPETCPQPHTVDSKCHSLVLSTRSDYFDRALRGGFVEKDTKVICITRQDEEDLLYFKLLLELSYAPSYTHDDEGAMFDRETRLRLALVANEYEFGGCIDACVASLSEGLDLTEQIMYMEEKLSVFRGRECVKAWMKRVIQALAEGGLGPVHQLYDEGPLLTEAAHGKQFYEVVPLKAVVKALPVEAMEALLGSDKLNVHVEDDAYYLLGAWLHQSIHVKAEDRVAIFKSLSAKIRFHHISADYLASVVTCCPLAYESGLLPSFLRSGLIQREANKQLIAVKKIETGACNRGSGNKELTFKTSVSLNDVLKLEKGGRIRRYMAVMAGFPIALSPEWVKPNTFGLYVQPLMPEVQGETFASCLDRHVGFRVSIQGASTTFQHLFDGKGGFGYHDFFSKPWQEIVHENSPYSPEGKTP